MVSTVLLCPPDYFQIEYEINAWMHRENRVDPVLAKEQHEQLRLIHQSLFANVHSITPKKGLPDMTYAANFGFVLGNTFIRSNFRYPQRRGEAAAAQAYFEASGYHVATLPDNIFFEGQGDMLYRDGKIYCGYGKRTMQEAIPLMEKILKRPIISFQVNNPYYYHLDTCFAPIGNDIVVINPISFTPEDMKKIHKNFSIVIETDTKDNQVLCCNMVEKNGTVVVGKGISENLREKLAKNNKKVIETPTSEFLKGGGSVKCLTLEFYQEE